jgi:hypothetical protein
MMRFWRTDDLDALGTVHFEHTGKQITNRVAFAPDGKTLCATRANELLIFKVDLAALAGLESGRDFVHYTTAKLVLVGDSGVGKTGLGWRLSHPEYRERETFLLQGGYRFPELADLGKSEQEVLLDAMVVRFLQHNVCFRETLGAETLLIFPGLIKQKRPLRDEVETVDDVSYLVRGRVENTYPAIAVLLGYTQAFTRDRRLRRGAQVGISGEPAGIPGRDRSVHPDPRRTAATGRHPQEHERAHSGSS